MSAHSSHQRSYRLVKALGDFHHDTINFLSFSPCGRFLASGGDDDYMCIYDCSDPRNCELSLKIKANSPPSAICWNPTAPISVFVGYGNGAIVKHGVDKEGGGWLPGVLLQNNSDRVVSLAWDQILAVATQSTVYLLPQNSNDIMNWITVPKPHDNKARSKPEPRAVVFTSDGSVLVAYLEHGVSCWTRDGKTQRWNFQPRAYRIGRFSYDSRKNMFIVHNLYDGFDAYKIKGCTVEHFRSYQLAASKECNVPLSCVFTEGGKTVAHGTTTGKAMVLDAGKVFTKQVLQHCEGDGLVQELAHSTPTSRSYTLLATTASECGANTVIKIWMGPANVGSEEIDYAGEIIEKVKTITNRLFERYNFLHRKTIEVPLIWLVAGALLIVAIILSAPTQLSYDGVFGPWSRTSVTWFLLIQQAMSSLLRVILRYLFAALRDVSTGIQQFIDEAPTVAASVSAIQGATLAGSVTAVATVTANQRLVLPIPSPTTETHIQPVPTLPTFQDPRDERAEIQVVVDHGDTEVVIRPFEE